MKAAQSDADRERVQTWLRETLHVSRETLADLDRLVALVLDEAARQNLISAATAPAIWTRHVLDSAQLHLHASGGTWLDIGTGAGFPGLVNAVIARRRHLLVEPRRIRAEFLRRVAGDLGLRAEVVTTPVERLQGVTPDVITARAVAPLARLLASAQHLAGPGTKWLLHKGRSAQDEIDAARQAFRGTFETLPSLAAPDSFLVRAIGVKPVK